MTLKKNLLIYVTALLIVCLAHSLAFAAAEKWDAASDISRLQAQAPSLEAFAGVKNIAWLNSYRYSMNSDGFMEKTHRLLIMSDRDQPTDTPMTHIIPLPRDGGSVVVTEASWYTPRDAKKADKEGDLKAEMRSAGGIEYLHITFPLSNQKKIIAIESVTTGAEQYALEDVLTLDGIWPVWEGSVTVKLSDGMTLYWRGDGLGEPERKKQGGIEQFTWSVFNQNRWNGSSIVEQKRPALVFSLSKGILPELNSLNKMAKSLTAPAIPASLNLPRNNLQRAGEGIDGYMKGMNIQPDGLESAVRQAPPEGGPWTPWEQTLIAGKWFEKLGYTVDILWKPVILANDSFPGAAQLWQRPVLLIKDGTKDIVYEPGQTVSFGKQPSSLYGAALYGTKGAVVDRITLPKGVASDHRLSQSWKLALDSNGSAAGTLEAYFSGAWSDIFALGDDQAKVLSKINDRMKFNVPGLDLKVRTVKMTSSACTILFDVSASLGIVSGNDILVHMPGCVPMMLEDIPIEESEYSFNFPFVLEQSLKLSVPKGYSVISLKKGGQQGDSKASIAENAEFWPGKRELNSDIRWTVKSNTVNKTLSGSIREQFMQYLYWSQKAVPFRKK